MLAALGYRGGEVRRSDAAIAFHLSKVSVAIVPIYYCCLILVGSVWL